MPPLIKRKRVVLSLKQKIDIINRLQKGEKAAILSKEYNVGISSVMDIKMKKSSILKYVSAFASNKHMHHRKTMRSALNKELDEAVYNWCVSMKDKQHLTGQIICEKALEVNNTLGGSKDFKASNGWLKNFKSRHGLDLSVNGADPSSNENCSLNIVTNSIDLKSFKPVAIKKNSVRRKRVVLNIKQKLDVISRLQNGESTTILAQEYNVGQSSIKDIKSHQNVILNYVSSIGSFNNINHRKTMRPAGNQELDAAVYTWCLESITAGQSINGPLICDKALELNRLAGGPKNFKASTGWLQNFKSRHSLFFKDNTFYSIDDTGIEIYPEFYEKESSPISIDTDLNQSSSSLPGCDVMFEISNKNYVSNQQVDCTMPINSVLLEAFDKVMDWANSQKECSSSDIFNLVKLREIAYKKEMSVAFSTNDFDAISKKIDNAAEGKRDESLTIEDMYEIGRCSDWICSNNFSKVALQFPDSMLNDATSVALKLGKLTEKQMFVMGDTSYGSCCVDEISAEHVSADAIIHFGHACLSPTKRLPVLYAFGKQVINIQDTTDSFRRLFPDKHCLVIVLYEVMYSYAIDVICEILKEYDNLVISRLLIPSEDAKFSSDLEISNDLYTITKFNRRILIPKNHTLNDYSIFYIGSQTITLTNFMLSLKDCHFFTYNPLLKVARAETLDVNKHLKRRYYYIEKAKDSSIIGILAGTLGVSNYLAVIRHLKELIKKAGKKSYTLVIGKINNAKLANFPEIDVFVNVACVESSLIESRDFYQSIITPYELEIALNQARKWTGDYIADFSEILPGAVHYVPPSEKEWESDVSLVTGKIRHTGQSSEETNIVSDLALISRNNMKVSAIHSKAAGEFLALRSWQGLEQHLGETPVSEIQQGQRGIASKYEDEKAD